MKREFEIRCTKENYMVVRKVINNFYKSKPYGYFYGKGVFKSNVLVKDAHPEYTTIWFKCMRKELNECRNTLREMVNAGLLLSTVEIW